MEHWRKNLIIMWFCQFLAMLGMSSIVPFLPLFIRDLGVSGVEQTAYWSGWVFAGPFLASFFLTPVWGSLGDRYGRKLMTLRAIFGLAIAQILVGLSLNVYHLFAARILQGVLSGFLPAAMALVAANSPKSKTAYAIGVLSSATAAGNIFGPLLGGIASDLLGFRNVFFLVASLLFVTGFIILFFVREENISDKKPKYNWLDNWKYILSNSTLFYISIAIMLASLGLAFVRPIFVLYVETFDIDTNYLPTITGALYGIIGLFSTISAVWWGKRTEKTGIVKNVIISSLISGIMYAIHSIIFDPYTLIPVRIILGLAYGGILPLLFAAVSNNVELERKGGIIGVATSFQIIGNVLGPLTAGIAVSLIGLRYSMILTGSFFIMITFISAIKLKK